MDALESGSERAEHFFQRWRRFRSFVGGATKHHVTLDELPDLARLEIFKRNEELLDASEDLYLVVARLRLLGAADAANFLLEAYDDVFVFRDPVILESQLPSKESREDARMKVQSQINRFHEAMSRHYLAINKEQ